MIPPFDLAWVGILPKMSPITDQENELLNLAPGFPITRTAPPGPNQGCSRLERSSYSGSPMSLGSPAWKASLALALKVHTRLVTPMIFIEDGQDSFTRPARLAWCTTGSNQKTKQIVGLSVRWSVHLLGALLYSIVTFYLASNR